MRIIDADALKRQFRKRELERSGYYINGADIYTIRKIINGTPTIEERPHGEWFGTVCTNCGESTSFYYDCNYCPQCGADMGIKGGEAELLEKKQ